MKLSSQPIGSALAENVTFIRFGQAPDCLIFYQVECISPRIVGQCFLCGRLCVFQNVIVSCLEKVNLIMNASF